MKTVLTVYRADLSGNLVSAAEGHGLIDKDGNGVAGSYKEVPLDVNSPFVKKPFRRELEFWLKRLAGKKGKRAKASGSDVAQSGPLAPAR